MKNRYFLTVLASASAAVILSGCGLPGQGSVQVHQPVSTDVVTDTTATSPNQNNQQNAAPQTAANENTVTEDHAKLIAVNDAGLTLDGVTFTKITHKLDDGIEQFEIEFYANQTEYDYDIDAVTGNILSSSKEFNQALPATQQPDAANPTQTQPVQPQQQATQQQQQTAQPQQQGTQQQPVQPGQQSGQQAQASITKEQALDIAIKAANVSASDVTFSRCNLEYEDDYGRNIYDVEFHVGRTEYSYDIDPDNGSILSYDVDLDD